MNLADYILELPKLRGWCDWFMDHEGLSLKHQISVCLEILSDFQAKKKILYV